MRARTCERPELLIVQLWEGVFIAGCSIVMVLDPDCACCTPIRSGKSGHRRQCITSMMEGLITLRYSEYKVRGSGGACELTTCLCTHHTKQKQKELT